MQESAKYLIRADITADGVVERNDVVGAIFGQTEGLLGDELDLRDLQDASKVGRIDVEIESEGGQSFGEVTIATNLDKVETAILGAALETIDQVGPCRAAIEVDRIEDVRAAKRRDIVDRAKQLLVESFDGSFLSSHELVEEVRASIRVEDVTEFEGHPAGPRVVDSDAIIVVEGRADVLTLLRYGVKNAVAVEGTDVPDDVAALTHGRTVTAFLDGDRGGELILRELAQVGDVDHVAFAPEGRSVEDLSRHEVMAALREKVPYETVADASTPHEVAATDGSTRPAPPADEGTDTPAPGTESPGPGTDTASGTDAAVADPPAESDAEESPADGAEGTDGTDGTDGARTADPGTGAGGTTAPDSDPRSDPGAGAQLGAGTASGTRTDADPESDADPEADAGPEADVDPEPEAGTTSESETDAGDPDRVADTAGRGRADAPDVEGEAGGGGSGGTAPSGTEPAEPETLRGHVRQVVDGETGLVRLLDGDFRSVTEGPAGEAFDLLEDAEPVPAVVVLDAELTQRILDVAAQRGIEQIVARAEGEFVKRPTDVRVRTAEALLA